MKRSDRIRRLRKSGLSYRKIAKKVGVSFQRCHQVITGYKTYPAHYPVELMNCRICGAIMYGNKKHDICEEHNL